MKELNEAMEKLLQYYRHEFLNILQVIGGLAQLQKTDRLLAFIQQASVEVQQFGRLIACGDPRFALAVHDYLLQDYKGTYILRVDGTLPLLKPAVLAALQVTLQHIQSSLGRFPDGILHVSVSGGQRPMLTLTLVDEANTRALWRQAATVAAENGLDVVFTQDGDEFSLHLDKDKVEGAQ
ncbi:MAG TPA: hypothetical protein GX699_12435 [Firmicutes bacterium]|nr:hypothetical protein [Bacillota bacterium]